MAETLYEIFQRSPEEALQHSFTEREQKDGVKTLFCWQSQYATCGKVRYGYYRDVTREELDSRKHQLEYLDGTISILWLDVRFDPKTKKKIPVMDPAECQLVLGEARSTVDIHETIRAAISE